eukprot:TRINITY_DN13817_c0_g1_i1.p1 TRINITY_DN13817_c0_g1~~TRINITY_DN13817_c0_g1_i1.p1  ORF type:complete len:175 (+),score=27.30 TRINITY_DN13817_c0_g1_i1:49-525(+)
MDGPYHLLPCSCVDISFPSTSSPHCRCSSCCRSSVWFTCARPFKKTKGRMRNELKNLWIQQNIYNTRDTLPGAVLRSEIKFIYTEEQNPLEIACSNVLLKNFELCEAITRYSACRLRGDVGVNTSPFTLLLKGMLDAAVGGGIRLYRELGASSYLFVG